MNENLFNVKIIVLNSTTYTRYDCVYAPASTLYSQKMISWSHGLSRAVNSLQLQPDKYDVIITSSAAMNI